MADNLPNPPARYSQAWANETKRKLDELMRNAYRRDRDVELGDGSVIARSPNGSRFFIKVDDDGNIITTSADAPAPTPAPPAPTPAPPASAPVNTVPSSSQLVVVSGSIVFNAANGNLISIDDAEGGTLTTTVSVSAGTLTVTGGSGATVTGDGGDSVTIVGTEAQVNAALDGMTFTAPATAQTVVVQVTTSDTTAPTPLADNDQISVAVVTAPPPPSVAPFVPFGSRMDLVNDKYPNAIVVSHKTQAQMDASIVTKYNAWRANLIIDDPVTPGGKAVNFGGGFLTVSEGMGYGMLLAAVLQDQGLFDQLLRTVRNHPAYAISQAAGMTIGNALMDWKINADGSSFGEGWNAMDGDMDIAMALLMADRTFGSNSTGWDYLGEARATINALKVWNMKSDGTTKGLATATVSRTSDYMLGHFLEFAAASTSTTDQTFWGVTCVSRCAQLIEIMQQQYSSVGALMPDFIVNTSGELDPNRGPYPSPGGMGDFVDTEMHYYANAQRNPWRWGTYLAFTADVRWRAIQEKLTTWIKAKTGGDPAQTEIGYHLDGTGMGLFPAPSTWPARGLVAGFMNGAQCNVQHQQYVNDCWDWLEENWVLQYYDSELMLLSMIVASGNWWNRITGKAANAPAPSPTPAPPAPTPAPPPSDGFPSKVVGLYFTGWDSSVPLTSITQDANVLYLFNAQTAGGGSWYWPWPNWPSAAQVQQCRARGQKVMLTLGGAGHHFEYLTRQQSEACISSAQSIISAFGGVDGIDWNNYEQQPPTQTFINEMIWMSLRFKEIYGADFAITTPPQPNSTTDRQLCTAMANAGALTYAAPQYYDWVGFNEVGFIRTRNRDWVNSIGADKVVLGLAANYSNGPSLADCTREWDAVEAEFPSQRGVFAWNAQLNHSGGSVWSATMRGRVIG